MVGETEALYAARSHLQGDFLGTLEFGAIIDSVAFAGDSLCCEYGYLINFDDETLEVYKGFNENPAVGRFANFDRRHNEYYPITLVGKYPWSSLPDMGALELELEEDED